MQDSVNAINAVAAIRVSTTKQGTDGDSPEAQKEQIERFAANKGLVIKKFFVFLESASKEQQPMQEAIDYCKDPKNGIQLFIIKSIDRFTRGGSLSYDLLKNQLESSQVRLIDIYGVISSEQVNTLEHLGLEYKWSVYSPSKKSEILEAERSKDELRDIMSRMIGAEIRYTRMGYWMRQPPYGFVSEKIETKNGKRTILKPHPEESKYMIKMYELRAERLLNDRQIVDKLNDAGYRSRLRYYRSKQDRTRIVSKRGGTPLTVKAMQKFLRNPIYAGINVEKWTNGEPIKCAFDGLVPIDLFNKANRGKRYITMDDQGEYIIQNKKPPKHLTNKGIRNADFPYRKFILCPQCNSPLLGSASTGKSGKRYPAYHCSNHGHYFRVPKAEMEARILDFISNLQVDQEQIERVMSVIESEYSKRQETIQEELNSLDGRIQALKVEAEATVHKIKLLTNQTALKYMEEELMKIEEQIIALEAQKIKKADERPVEIQPILKRVRYFLEHLDELLVKQIDPVRKAQFFGAIFDKPPTYDEINPGTQKTPFFTGVNPIFKLASAQKSLMVTSRGIEPLLPG